MRSLAAAVVALVASTTSASAQESRVFGDWVVGCDNLRRCSAIGLAPADGEHIAFVSIVRDGQALAAPRLTVALYTETLYAGAPLTLAFDDAQDPLQVVSHEQLNGFLRADITGDPLAVALAGVLRADRLAVTGDAGGSGETAATVSLAGASAALRFMDDRQRRAGTVTALVARGSKPGNTVPAVPAMPTVGAKPMRELPDPAGALPQALIGIGADDPGCAQGADPIAARLSASVTLWGVCESAGAYNLSYALFLVEGGEAFPLVLEAPDPERGGRLVDQGNILLNPYIVEGGLVLSSIARGRGLGDCGVIADWAWDGGGFRLLGFTMMAECRGVPVDDWPVLYRARRR